MVLLKEVKNVKRKKEPVAVIGCTGVVGQKAVALLLDHPLFSLGDLVASPQSKGRRFGEFFWGEKRVLPDKVAQQRLIGVDEVQNSFAVSAVSNRIAESVEPALLAKGVRVYSNASWARGLSSVPMVVPEVNGDLLQQTPLQHVAGTNCMVAVVAPALLPLIKVAAVEHVSVFTMQAISGAGQKGLFAMQMQDNLVPYIQGEEEKIRQELCTLLDLQDRSLLVSCTRVPISVGHMARLHIQYKSEVQKKQVFSSLEEQQKRFPYSYQMCNRMDQPQPCQLAENDMKIYMGPVEVQGKRVAVTVLGHNLVRGAAGLCLANASFAVQESMECALH